MSVRLCCIQGDDIMVNGRKIRWYHFMLGIVWVAKFKIKHRVMRLGDSYWVWRVWYACEVFQWVQDRRNHRDLENYNRQWGIQTGGHRRTRRNRDMWWENLRVQIVMPVRYKLPVGHEA
jgi:hypothetical protein